MTWAIFLQLGASVTKLIQMWLMGNKTVTGPVWGLFSNAFWWGVMIEVGLWWLAPFNAIMVGINVRNLIKWSTDEYARGTP